MKGQFPGAGRLRSAYPSLFEVLQITLAVFVLQAQAFADSPAPPRDYRTVTENQKYVFVMLAPAGWSQQDSGIRKTYTQSGLYKNDGSTTPFWTVDWYANLVFPASDGEYLIRMGPWAKGYPEEAGAMILVDTGPCVALFDRKDAEHERCRELLRAIREPLYTTVSVLTEAFHMLSPGSWGSDRLRDFISQGGLSVFFLQLREP